MKITSKSKSLTFKIKKEQLTPDYLLGIELQYQIDGIEFNNTISTLEQATLIIMACEVGNDTVSSYVWVSALHKILNRDENQLEIFETSPAIDILEYGRLDTPIQERLNQIRNWGFKKGIYESGDLKTQTLKLAEEVGELSRAILKNDEPEIIDAIGDCVVVLTNLTELFGKEYVRADVTIETCVESAWNVIKNRTGKMDNGTFKKD